MKNYLKKKSKNTSNNLNYLIETFNNFLTNEPIKSNFTKLSRHIDGVPLSP